MAITTTLDKVRLHAGDTDETRPLLNDDEINFLIAERGDNVLLAAADACDAIAAKFAREYDVEWQGAGQGGARSKLTRSQMSKQYADRAKALRARAESTLGVIGTTRADGYSDDLSARDGAATVGPGGRVRAGYRDPDLRA